MNKIDNATAKATKDPYGAEGAPGYFQDTNPGGGTIVPAWWCNQTQEEISNVILSVGTPLDKDNDGQLSVAIDQKIINATPAIVAAAVSQVMQSLYPVGEFLSTLRAGNPSTWLGFGTWQRYAAGRVAVGYDSNQVEFDTIEKVGGEKTHTLSISELPIHHHDVQMTNDANELPTSNYSRLAPGHGTTRTTGIDVQVRPQGGDQPHNNLQPYFVSYIWKRTA